MASGVFFMARKLGASTWQGNGQTVAVRKRGICKVEPHRVSRATYRIRGKEP